MALDPSISLQVQTPNPMNTLGNLVNTANAVQSYQSNNIQLQAQKQANLERQNVMKLIQSDPSMKPQADGTFDLSQQNIQKLQQAAPQTWTDWAQKAADTNTKMTAAKQSVMNLGKDNAGLVAQTMNSTQGMPMDKRIDALSTLSQQFPGIKPYIDQVANSYAQVNENQNLPQEQRSQAIDKLDNFWSRFNSTLTTQQESNTPTLQTVNTGAEQVGVNVKPGVQGIPVGQAVTDFKNELPPTTPAFNQQTKTPGYVGSPTVSSGPALGQPETASNQASNVQEDWKTVQANADNAKQDIGVLQNMKLYAKGAINGVESERASYLSGLAGYLGISSAQLAKTDTDLLAKNEKMLALAGGNTNLAKELAQGANPHTTMTPEAIRHAADQVIAQKQLLLNRQQFLLPHASDPEGYQAARNYFNQIADPRVLQYPSMTAEEKSALKTSMTPAEREKFGAMITANRKLGFIQ